MAITVDWAVTQVIDIPQADLVATPDPNIFQLNLDAFRLALKDLEAAEQGMPWTDTHAHTAPVSIGATDLARVVEILDPYTITFEDGQYAVEVVGGNSNVGPVTNVNQVSVRTNNSAGLTYSKQAEDSAFEDARVWIDTVDGLPGTVYPRGTPGDPVDNLIDAQIIIQNRNLPKRLQVRGQITAGATANLNGYNIAGASERLARLTLTAGVTTVDMVLERIEVTGTFDGRVTARESTALSNISNFTGSMNSVGLQGTIGFGQDPTGNAYELINCFSVVPGTTTPILDFNGLSDQSINIRNFSGGLTLRELNDPDNLVSIDCDPAFVNLDSTVTEGLIVARGVGTVFDNSGPNVSVVKNGLVEGQQLRDLFRYKGLDPDFIKTITENTEGLSYDVSVPADPKDPFSTTEIDQQIRTPNSTTQTTERQ